MSNHYLLAVFLMFNHTVLGIYHEVLISRSEIVLPIDPCKSAFMAHAERKIFLHKTIYRILIVTDFTVFYRINQDKNTK
jgi:hypothetical protein